MEVRDITLFKTSEKSKYKTEQAEISCEINKTVPTLSENLYAFITYSKLIEKTGFKGF